MNSCDECNGSCCRYVTVSLDEPEDVDDWDEFKWWVMHENVSIYQCEDKSWNVQFQTICKNLGEDNRCKIYPKRPIICRNFDPAECHGTGSIEASVKFTEPEDIEKYLLNVIKSTAKIVAGLRTPEPLDADAQLDIIKNCA